MKISQRHTTTYYTLQTIQEHPEKYQNNPQPNPAPIKTFKTIHYHPQKYRNNPLYPLQLLKHSQRALPPTKLTKTYATTNYNHQILHSDPLSPRKISQWHTTTHCNKQATHNVPLPTNATIKPSTKSYSIIQKDFTQTNKHTLQPPNHPQWHTTSQKNLTGTHNHSFAPKTIYNDSMSPR